MSRMIYSRQGEKQTIYYKKLASVLEARAFVHDPGRHQTSDLKNSSRIIANTFIETIPL